MRKQIVIKLLLITKMDPIFLKTVGAGVFLFVLVFLIMYYAVYEKLKKKEKNTQKLLEYCLLPATVVSVIIPGGYYYYNNKEPKIELSEEQFWDK